MASADPAGVEPLPGETDAAYAARQARLREEAAARMKAKFGHSAGLHGKLGGVGNSSAPPPLATSRSSWGFFGSVLGSVTELAKESAGGLAQLASDVGGAAVSVGGAAGGLGRQLAIESVEGLAALAHDTAGVASGVSSRERLPTRPAPPPAAPKAPLPPPSAAADDFFSILNAPESSPSGSTRPRTVAPAPAGGPGSAARPAGPSGSPRDLPSLRLLHSDLPSLHLLQADLPSLHLLEPDLPSLHLLQADLPSLHLLAPDLPSLHLLHSYLPSLHLLAPDLPSLHLLAPDLPSLHLLAPDLPSLHLLAPDLPSLHLLQSDLPSLHLLQSDLPSLHLLAPDLPTSAAPSLVAKPATDPPSPAVAAHGSAKAKADGWDAADGWSDGGWSDGEWDDDNAAAKRAEAPPPSSPAPAPSRACGVAAATAGHPEMAPPPPPPAAASLQPMDKAATANAEVPPQAGMEGSPHSGEQASDGVVPWRTEQITGADALAEGFASSNNPQSPQVPSSRKESFAEDAPSARVVQDTEGDSPVEISSPSEEEPSTREKDIMEVEQRAKREPIGGARSSSIAEIETEQPAVQERMERAASVQSPTAEEKPRANEQVLTEKEPTAEADAITEERSLTNEVLPTTDTRVGGEQPTEEEEPRVGIESELPPAEEALPAVEEPLTMRASPDEEETPSEEEPPTESAPETTRTKEETPTEQEAPAETESDEPIFGEEPRRPAVVESEQRLSEEETPKEDKTLPQPPPEEEPPIIEGNPTHIEPKRPSTVEEAPAEMKSEKPSAEEQSSTALPTEVESEKPSDEEEAPTMEEALAELEKPPNAEELPTEVESEKTSAEEVPPSIEEAPAEAESESPFAEEEPLTIEEAPAEAESESPSAEEAPLTIEEAPAEAESESPCAEEEPLTIEEAPAEAESESPCVEEEPLTIEEAPAEAESRKPSDEEEPPTMEEAAEEVESHRPSAEEEPAETEPLAQAELATEIVLPIGEAPQQRTDPVEESKSDGEAASHAEIVPPVEQEAVDWDDWPADDWTSPVDGTSPSAPALAASPPTVAQNVPPAPPAASIAPVGAEVRAATSSSPSKLTESGGFRAFHGLTSAGKRFGKAFATESVQGLTALAQDTAWLTSTVADRAASRTTKVVSEFGAVGLFAGDAVRLGRAVGTMVVDDFVGGADKVTGDKASVVLSSATEVTREWATGAREVGELAGSAAHGIAANAHGVLNEGAGKWIGSIKDNVITLDAVGRSTMGTLRDRWVKGEETKAVAAELEVKTESLAPPRRSFEEWLDELGGGTSMELLEGMKDGCAIRVGIKIAQLAVAQRTELDGSFQELDAFLSYDADDDAAVEEDEHDSPSHTRLAAFTLGELRKVQEDTLSRIRRVVEECEVCQRRAVKSADAATMPSREETQSQSNDESVEKQGIDGGGEKVVAAATAPGALPRLPDTRAADPVATTVLTPLALAKDGMLSIEACAALGLAQLCAMALRVLVGYGARCRQEADRPSKPQPDTELSVDDRVHALDCTFVTELERARWKGRCVRAMRIAFTRCIEEVSQGCLDAARKLHRAVQLSSGAKDLNQVLKAVSSAVYLDSGSAISLVQEATQCYMPILHYIASGDISR
ncbi:hypothetical protein AB1Y20_023606 [Prymnesium parvum]|uniref:Uncharacterized protein n=1 Tax=Prymnesium parvum TaxID=97485 RepID=A0AB34JHK3_PRYPA